MHPRAYFLVVACNIINDKSGWLYFHASCCRLRNRCLSRSTCIGGLSLPSSHALRFDQGAFKLASFFDCPVEQIPSLDLVFCNNLIFHFIILCFFSWGSQVGKQQVSFLADLQPGGQGRRLVCLSQTTNLTASQSIYLQIMDGTKPFFKARRRIKRGLHPLQANITLSLLIVQFSNLTRQIQVLQRKDILQRVKSKQPHKHTHNQARHMHHQTQKPGKNFIIYYYYVTLSLGQVSPPFDRRFNLTLALADTDAAISKSRNMVTTQNECNV